MLRSPAFRLNLYSLSVVAVAMVTLTVCIRNDDKQFVRSIMPVQWRYAGGMRRRVLIHIFS